MAFVGITFDGQNVAPSDDGALYQAHYGDGIIDGCTMSLSGDDLVIQSGHIIACGRQCKVDGATSVDLSGRLLSTGYIQVILNYDLTQSEGNQWYESFVESATTTFPALTTDDINDTGTLYQLQLAVIQISGGNLTTIYSSLRPSNLVSNDAVVIYGDSNINPYIWGYKEGDPCFNINGTSTSSIFSALKSDGTRGGGIYCESNDGRAIVFGDNANIVIRPKGVNDSTAQATFDTTAQIHGALKESSTTASSSLTPTIGNVTTLLSIANLPKGIYLVQGYANMNPSGSSTTPVNYGVGTSAGSPTYIDCRITTGGVRTRSSLCWMLNVTNDNSTIYFTAEFTVNSGTITNRTLRVVNLG